MEKLFGEFNKKGIEHTYYHDRKVLTIWIGKIPYDLILKEIRADNKTIK